METKGEKIFFYIIQTIVAFLFFTTFQKIKAIYYCPFLSKDEKIKSINSIQKYCAKGDINSRPSGNWKMIYSDNEFFPAVWKKF